jgi:hypothetical protein
VSDPFDAGEAVEALGYDFTTAKSYEGPEPGKGEIPEPTDKRLRDFGAAIKKEAGTKSTGQAVTVFQALAPEKLEAAATGLCQTLSDLCGGHPSVEELKGLPPRLRRKFLLYMIQALFNPKAQESGTGL